MAKKTKKNLETSENECDVKISKENLKTGYRIILKTKNFIIIDKHGINVKIKLPIEELVKYSIDDMFYLWLKLN